MSDSERSPAWKTYGVDQAVIELWVRSRFGDKVFEDREERGLRVFEEAAELLQSIGSSKGSGDLRERAHALVDRVFDRPIGEVNQEIGGLGVTLLALCARVGVRLDSLVDTEIARIHEADSEQFRRKQTDKADLGLAARPE